MEWQGWYTIAVVGAGVLVMARDLMGADFAMLGILIALLIPGSSVVSLEEGLAGFSNAGLLTVGVLFVMAAGISETGGLDYAFSQVLGTPKTARGALVKMLFPIAAISAFLNNTPVVAIMIPIILTWCRKTGLAPGHLFMPLSFASILGGTITLIGTSTNLVVAGKQRETFPNEAPIGIFDITPFGVPVALAGIVYIVLFAPKLLPGVVKGPSVPREGGSAELDDAFLVGLQVMPGSSAAGRTVQDAGMRGLAGVYLTSVKRADNVIHAVGPDFLISCGDLLFFAGQLSQVSDVAERFGLKVVADAFEEDLPAMMGSPRHAPTGSTAAGPFAPPADPLAAPATLGDLADESALLSSIENAVANDTANHASHFPARLMNARVLDDAPDLLNVTIRDADFRSKFQAAIVSIRRAGEKLQGKLGDVELAAGDMLLFDAGAGFDAESDRVKNNLELVTPSPDEQPEREFMFAFQVDRKLRRQGSGSLPTSNSIENLADKARHLRPRAGNIVGKSIEAVGLRGLPDAFLVAIERQGVTLHAVPPTEILQPGDVLWFAGSADGVISLRKVPGLKQVDDQVEKLSSHVLDRRLVQVVIARSSVLIGKSVKETHFRTRFDAAIIAIHRAGERLRMRIGDVHIAAGDVLLLDTGAQFQQNHHNDRNFALVAEVADSRPPRFDRVVIAVVAAMAAIAAAIAGFELFIGAALASAVMLLTGCLGGDAARRAVKWDVLVTIAAAFGISNALENTGAAKAIADVLVSAGRALGGGAAMQVAVYLATMLLSNVVANNAAAALMYPIAIGVAQAEGLRTDRIAFLLMLAASASFAVPFGYQTNLMVYGAGGYKFKDFLRFGGPMQIWQAIISIAVILLADYVAIVWTVTISVTFVVLAGPAIYECIQMRRSKRDSERLHQ